MTQPLPSPGKLLTSRFNRHPEAFNRLSCLKFPCCAGTSAGNESHCLELAAIINHGKMPRYARHDQQQFVFLTAFGMKVQCSEQRNISSVIAVNRSVSGAAGRLPVDLPATTSTD